MTYYVAVGLGSYILSTGRGRECQKAFWAKSFNLLLLVLKNIDYESDLIIIWELM